MIWRQMLRVILFSLFMAFVELRQIISKKPEVRGPTGALLYLSRFGYMDESVQARPQSSALITEDSLKQAIKDFQAFAGLNVTGELDEETIKMMNMPRCGLEDKIGFGANARRRKRYALQGSRWRVDNLTFKVTKYPLSLTKAEVDRDLQKAFEIWEEATDLTFVQVEGNGKIHIEIRFEQGEHGDGDPFDGPGGTLAHAYFPIYGGDVHFDNSEVWTVRSYRGTNLFQVAAHEIGHSLGLSHSDVQSALMAPFYRGYVPNFKLDSDDIKAIQSLYGEKNTASSKPSVKTNTKVSSDSELCSDPSFDTMVTMKDEKTYVFKGSNYWQLLDNGIAEGYPRNITEDFGGLEGDLDAAFTWKNGKTFYFKGDKYWRLTDLTMDPSYPRDISKGFAGIPSNVDAAFVWSGNDKIYFFKGLEYWRFDSTQTPPVARHYPKKISQWKGIPNDIDAALQYSNGYTYFFKNGKYYRFHDSSFKVDRAKPPFPRPVGYWWFGCPSEESQQQQSRPIHSAHKEIIPIASDNVYEDNSFDADGGRIASIKEKSSSLIQQVGSSTQVGRSGATCWKAKYDFTWTCFLIISLFLSQLF